MQFMGFKKDGIRFWAMLLVLVCAPILLLFSNTGNDSILQAMQSSDINQCPVYSRGIGETTLSSTPNQTPVVDAFIHHIGFFQTEQQLLSDEQLSNNKNNRYVTTSCKLSCSSFFLETSRSFIYLSRQIPVCGVKRFLIAPNSPHAPPYILA